jgi:hypothetical protein
MKPICKNCKHYKSTTEFADMTSHPLGSCSIVPPNITRFDGSSRDIGIVCGWDSDVLMGENFGCINFEEKKG